jgi:hypothetical protein
MNRPTDGRDQLVQIAERANVIAKIARVAIEEVMVMHETADGTTYEVAAREIALPPATARWVSPVVITAQVRTQRASPLRAPPTNPPPVLTRPGPPISTSSTSL